MRGITLGYFLRRLGIFFLTIWIAATVIWLIPRLAPGDPITAMISRMSRSGGGVEKTHVNITGWEKGVGLEEPLPLQDLRYLGKILPFSFVYSLACLPTTRHH